MATLIVGIPMPSWSQTGEEIMTDNLNIRRPQDPTKINVHESWEVRYWTHHFGVSEQQLKDAVKAVGVSAAAVKKRLGR